MKTALMTLTVVALFPPILRAEDKMPSLTLSTRDAVFQITLNDSATARDFAALLPLDIELSDYNRVEKVFSLPRRLTTQGAPEGYDPAPGDVALFAPWGNIVLYYGDAPWYRGIVPIGRFGGDLDALSRADGPAVIRAD
ncbi:MAG: cyclophilin-like fold protein [Paracoccus sp. (in: a-proteobacteria)]|uniref:cyclophilin-like fold protein n=1 Tax=Paracoccus sp. TaxID=267 RepID=UPI0026E0764A|nr:cyclophilin-like fold protein [Paracoccus sp. (in: a-proteobacteria)]MDO5632587.1 cyclophilin-like fold protein [Paracoccus sp. (in: a-proteobacteria)]